MQNDGDDIMVCIFTSKVVCPSSLTVCEHQESTFPSPTVVMHSISLEHDPPAERNNLIRDVVVVTDLRILDFLSISFSCNQTSARSSLKSNWISMAIIPTLLLLLHLAGRVGLKTQRAADLLPKHPLMSTAFLL